MSKVHPDVLKNARTAVDELVNIYVTAQAKLDRLDASGDDSFEIMMGIMAQIQVNAAALTERLTEENEKKAK